MTVLLALLLLMPGGAFASAKAALQKGVAGLGADPDAALSRMYAENPSSVKLQEPAAVAKTRAAVLPAAPLKPAAAAAEPPAPPLSEGLYRSEMDKVSVLAALGYLKIGVMQGGAVAVYGFGSLGRVSGWASGPRGQLTGVLNSAAAQGVLAAVAASVVDHSRYSPDR